MEIDGDLSGPGILLAVQTLRGFLKLSERIVYLETM